MKPLAKELIAKFGSFAEVISAPPAAAGGGQGPGRGRRHRAEDRAGRGDPPRARRRCSKRAVLSSWSTCSTIAAPPWLRRQGAVPHPVPRQAQPADRRRGAADRHGRSHAGLSARGGQARARTVGDRDHPGAQPSVGRSDAVTRRHRDDARQSSRWQSRWALRCTTTSSSDATAMPASRASSWSSLACSGRVFVFDQLGFTSAPDPAREIPQFCDGCSDASYTRPAS